MNTLISKLLGTAVGVKIGNDTIIGLLVGVAWDEKIYKYQSYHYLLQRIM